MTLVQIHPLTRLCLVYEHQCLWHMGGVDVWLQLWWWEGDGEGEGGWGGHGVQLMSSHCPHPSPASPTSPGNR